MAIGAGGIRAGRAFVVIGAIDKTALTLRRISTRLRAFGAQISAIGRQLTLIAVVAALPIALSARVFANFADQMSKVRAITGATGEDFMMLTEEAKKLGRTTSFTASQVASAMVELARAGFDPSQINTFTKSVLDLARATDTELPRATEIAGGTLRAFQLETSDMIRVVDVLVTTANKSAQTLEDLGEAMKFVAPIAAKAGLTLEDTAAAIGILANVGIKGSMAGTGLRKMLISLADPAKRTNIERLGIQVTDANNNLLPMIDILENLGKRMEGLGSARQLQIFKEAFGVRAITSAINIADLSEKVKELTGALRDSGGTARKTSKIMDDNLGGSIRILLSAVEGIAIAIGESLQKTFRDWAKTMIDVSGKITRFITDNQELIVTILKTITVVGIVGVSLIIIGFLISSIGTILGALAGVLSLVTTAFVALGTVITFLASPLGIIIGLIGIVISSFLRFSESFRSSVMEVSGFVMDRFSSMADTVTSTFQGMLKALAIGDFKAAFEIAIEGVQIVWLELTDLMADVWSKFTGFFVELWRGAVLSVKKIFFSLTKSIASNIANNAKAIRGFLIIADPTGFVAQITGIDALIASEERLLKLERERLAGLEKLKEEFPEIGPTTGFQDPRAETIRGIQKQFDTQIAQASKEAGDKLRDFRAGIAESNKARDDEINKRKANLQKLVDAIEERVKIEKELSKFLEEDPIIQAIKRNLKKAEGGGIGGLDQIRRVAAPGLLKGIEAGTVEALQAAQRVQDNLMAKQVEISEEQRDLLKNIDRNLEETQQLQTILEVA